MDWSVGGRVRQNGERIAQRVILIFLRVAGAEAVSLRNIPVDLGIALIRVVRLIGLVNRVVGQVPLIGVG